ncbi:MAG: hypothetical protein ACJ8DC_10540 [Gemmatimonadales bacterium]
MPTNSTSPGAWASVKDLVETASKIATIVLAVVAYYATQQYNRQQDLQREAHEREQRLDQQQQAALHQIQTIIGLFDPLASPDLKKHNLAVITVKELTANIPLAIKLCLAAASQAECASPISAFGTDTLLALSRDTTRSARPLRQTAARALDYQQAEPDSSGDRHVVTSTAAGAAGGGRPAPGITPSKSGWVFLGSYNDSTWATRYLEFPARTPPASLRGQSLPVRPASGALNVRGNLFYEAGYDRILDVLTPGSMVTVDSIDSYAGGGYYIWARVRYRLGSR